MLEKYSKGDHLKAETVNDLVDKAQLINSITGLGSGVDSASGNHQTAYQLRDCAVVKFQTTTDWAAYPDDGDGCVKFPAKKLSSIDFGDDASAGGFDCTDVATHGTLEEDNMVVYNASPDYIPENSVLLAWRVNGKWYVDSNRETAIAKFTTDSTYPVRGDGCNRFPAKILYSATFTEAQCYEALTEGSPADDEIIVLNLEVNGFIPENTVLPIWRWNGRWYCYYTEHIHVVKFGTSGSYPARASDSEECNRYPAYILSGATFTESTCYEAITPGANGDEIIVFNLSENYIPEDSYGLVWYENGRWWTIGNGFESIVAVGKCTSTDSAPCDRFSFDLLPDVTFDNSTTCADTLTEGSVGDEIVAWNLGPSHIPEDTILPLYYVNQRYYCYYSEGDKLQWGLVESGFVNVSPASSKTRVVVKECDIDGAGVTGPTFPVFIPIKGNKATAVFYNDVVGYVEDDDDNKVIVTDAYDDVFHTVKMYSEGATGPTGPANIPDGWYLADGNNGTVDLSAKFVMGYDAGTWELGATGGYEWHGKGGGTGPAGNNHPDHEPHGHPLCVIETLYGATGATGPNQTSFKSIDSCVTGDEDHALEHLGPFNSDEDTDNKPPYYVLAFIERID
jgi:hypothetical protein